MEVISSRGCIFLIGSILVAFFTNFKSIFSFTFLDISCISYNLVQCLPERFLTGLTQLKKLTKDIGVSLHSSCTVIGENE